MIRKIIYLFLICCLLVLTCSENSSSNYNGNISSPSLIQNSAVVPASSPSAIPQKQDASVPSMQYSNTNMSDIYNYSNEKCLSNYSNYFEEYYQYSSSINGVVVTEDCSKIQVKDGNKTIFQVKLNSDNCQIDLKADFDNFKIDTTYNICN